MDSTHHQALLCMKLSLDWTEMLKAVINHHNTVGIGAVLVYIIFTEPNNSLSTGDKVLTAICFLAFECFMILVLFLLAVAQWYKYLRLWREDEDWKKFYVYPPMEWIAMQRIVAEEIYYQPHYLVWESVAILVINYFHLAVEHIVYKISSGAPEFMFADSVFFAIIFGSLQFMVLHCLTMITDADSLNLIRKRILNHQLV
ncbi:hypothetical protein WN943_027194 [Citrus x changshan-huyou]